MTPYLVAFASFLLVYFAVETNSGHRSASPGERLALLLPLAIFAVMYAGQIGTDVESYGGLFEIAEDYPLEPGFSILMIGAKSIGLDYIAFTKVLAIVQMMLLAYVVLRLRDPLFFLLFYLSAFFLNFQFNAIRNSFALLIIAAFYVRAQRPGVAALAGSSVIHYSSVLTLGLQRLATIRRQWLAIGAVAVLALGFAALWLHPEIAGDRLGDLFVYKGYLEQDYETKSFYPALLLKLVVAYFFLRNGGAPFYFRTYAILVVLVHVVSPILSRLCDLVLFLALLDVCARQRLQNYRGLAVALTLVLVVSSLLIPWNDCQHGGEDRWCLVGGTAR